MLGPLDDNTDDGVQWRRYFSLEAFQRGTAAVQMPKRDWPKARFCWRWGPDGLNPVLTAVSVAVVGVFVDSPTALPD